LKEALVGNMEHHTTICINPPKKSVDVINGQLFEETTILPGFDDIVPEDVHHASILAHVEEGNLVLGMNIQATAVMRTETRRIWTGKLRLHRSSQKYSNSCNHVTM